MTQDKKEIFDPALGERVRVIDSNSGRWLEGRLTERGISNGKLWYKLFEYPTFAFDSIAEAQTEEEED